LVFCHGLVADDENDQSAIGDAFDLLHMRIAARVAGLLGTAQTSSVVNADRDRVEEMRGRLASNGSSAASPFHNHIIAT
jgi:hypothetical protein